MISLPTAVEPVKAILSTPGFLTSSCPVSGPPVTCSTRPPAVPPLLPVRQSATPSAESARPASAPRCCRRPAPAPASTTASSSGKFHAHDRAHNSHRLAQRVGERALEGIDRFAVNLGRPAGVVAENVHHHRHINVAGLKDRLAVVERLQLGKLVDVASRPGRRVRQSSGRVRSPTSCARGRRGRQMRCAPRLPPHPHRRRSPPQPASDTSPVAGLMVSKLWPAAPFLHSPSISNLPGAIFAFVAVNIVLLTVALSPVRLLPSAP